MSGHTEGNRLTRLQLQIARLRQRNRLDPELQAFVDDVERLVAVSNAVVADIHAFDVYCEAAEYTDTGRVWDLFDDIRTNILAGE